MSSDTRKHGAVRLALAGVASLVVSGLAAASSVWSVDDNRYGFTFGNHLDATQQTTYQRGELSGYLYVAFTGEYHGGYPIAVSCTALTPRDQCVAAWRISGVAGRAQFLYAQHDEPVWFVESRNLLPRPGAHTFFHWASTPGSDASTQAGSSDPSCAAAQVSQLLPGDFCEGYFIQLQAIETFVFESSGQRLLIVPGIDTASHSNIVTSHP